MKTDLTYLEHIEECIRRVEKNTAGGREAVWRVVREEIPGPKAQVKAMIAALPPR